MGDTINRAEIAKKLGISFSCLRSIFKWGDSGAIPKPLGADRRISWPGSDPYLYDRQAVMVWLASKPLQRYQAKTPAAKKSVTERLVGLDVVNAKKFLTGQFDPWRRQRATMARKMAARQAAPTRRVVTVNTDYWEDDNDS